MTFQELTKSLEQKIQDSYLNGVTLEQAELLAGEFLYAQMAVSAELKKSDLDARMKKTGIKAVRAAVYMDAATKDPKKPSDVMLQALVDMNDIVQTEQNTLDVAEAARAELERIYSIFQNAHIHFRGVAKGKFE